jgi:DNA-binding transcriptional regulator YbjK
MKSAELSAEQLVTAHAKGMVSQGMHGIMHRRISAEVDQPNN